MSPSTAAEIDDFFYLPAEEFFPAHRGEALTFDDISLATHYSRVLPSDTDPTIQLTETTRLSTPVLSADMDTVTEGDVAIAISRAGGLGMLHSNFTPENQIKEVGRVKHAQHGIIEDPITVSPQQYIGDVLSLIEDKQYKFSTFPVIDESGILIGLLWSGAVKDRNKTKRVFEVMKSPEQIRTVPEDEMRENPIQRAEKFFAENNDINKLLIIDSAWKLKGLVTASDIERITQDRTSLLKPTYDDKHRLQVGATLYLFRNSGGALDRERIIAHTGALVDKWIDIVGLSTAHGYTETVGDAIAMVRGVFPNLPIMAGNVTSARGVEFLAQKGANVIKGGQGPGKICSTRIVAGVGIPQMTALYVMSRMAKQVWVTLISDGGINTSGDMVKALTLADAVMIGSLIAASVEAPWEITVGPDGQMYKEYRGMGSLKAMERGSAARYWQGIRDKTQKLVPEGVVWKELIKWPLADIIAELRWGLQSGMGYHGAQTLEKLRAIARYVYVTAAGQKEAKPRI